MSREPILEVFSGVGRWPPGKTAAVPRNLGWEAQQGAIYLNFLLKTGACCEKRETWGIVGELFLSSGPRIAPLLGSGLYFAVEVAALGVDGHVAGEVLQFEASQGLGAQVVPADELAGLDRLGQKRRHAAHGA